MLRECRKMEKTDTEKLDSASTTSSDGSVTTHETYASSFASTESKTINRKPHRSSDASLSAAIRRDKTFRDFRLIRQIGSGDIGRVYLCQIRNNDEGGGRNGGEFYAMKVVDKEVLALKKKTHRAEMEKKVLKMLDHPFLPNVYAQFEASNYSCVVMEFCSGGDLHSLRHKLPQKKFSVNSARFYGGEVLVALEYLHMLGIIYRDLKPENVLVRSDGHIMLSDFDLSLCSDAIPAVESRESSPLASPTVGSSTSPRPGNPFSCFPNRIFRSRKVQTLASNRVFVAEPISARSCSFVGTHEYVSPEVAAGGSHGNAVDWWAFGIFLYEMIYGFTPFAGGSNEATLRNIVKRPLKFASLDAPVCAGELQARDLISGLLCKDPANRLGSKRGAAEIKTHPFFKSLNFALIRSVKPPEIPGLRRQATTSSRKESSSGGNKKRDFDCF